MTLIFDGPSHPFGFVVHSLLGVVPLAVWAYLRFLRKRPATIALPIIGVAILVGINGIQFWDQWRIRGMLKTGKDVQVTQGVITESWRIVTRSRDWTKAHLAYKTTTSEGFDVAGVRFSWNIADSFSPATFSNAADPAVEFPKGAQVEVTWFVDPADNDQRRILRLRMSKAVSARAENAPTSGDFTAFQAQFAAAFSAGDTGRLTTLTRFPFRFGNHTMEASEAASLWQGLLMPAIQSCIAFAAPEVVEEGGMLVRCPPAQMVFRREGKGEWRFVEIRE